MMQENSTKTTAVLLIAHGSRRPEANADLARLAERVRERRVYAFVEIAYLELASPTIPEGIATCAGHSPTRVLMMPYFLSAGSHVSDDLERFRRQAAADFPAIEFQLCPPLGLHDFMVDLVMHRLSETENMG